MKKVKKKGDASSRNTILTIFLFVLLLIGTLSLRNSFTGYAVVSKSGANPITPLIFIFLSLALIIAVILVLAYHAGNKK
mgnify:FL=1